MYKSVDDYFAPALSREIIKCEGISQELTDDDLNEILGVAKPDSDAEITGAKDEVSGDASVGKDGEDDLVVAGAYRFPELSQLAPWIDKYQEKASKELLEILGKLSYTSRNEAGEPAPYFEVRDELCAISLLLNERGDYAPKVRYMRVPPSVRKLSTKYTADEQALSNDRQIIDLHWLYLKQVPVMDVPGYEGMLNTGLEFDWLRTSLFVARVGSTEKKAMLLGLTEFDQLQLAAIQTKAVSDRWRTIREGQRSKMGMIRTAASAANARLDAQAIARLPEIYLALRVARGSSGMAADAYRWIAGQTISKKEMSRRLLWMRRLGLLNASE
jgi:hypothetical protein